VSDQVRGRSYARSQISGIEDQAGSGSLDELEILVVSSDMKYFDCYSLHVAGMGFGEPPSPTLNIEPFKSRNSTLIGQAMCCILI